MERHVGKEKYTGWALRVAHPCTHVGTGLAFTSEGDALLKAAQHHQTATAITANTM